MPAESTAAPPPFEQPDDPVLEAVAERTGGIVTGYHVVAAFIDDDGTTAIYWETLADQPSHVTLGLLTEALTAEKARVRLAVYADEDD